MLFVHAIIISKDIIRYNK